MIYLHNRQQFVRVENEKSQNSLIRNGVPQGSNLGPLLFNMMLFDLKYVDTVSEIVKFADDIAMTLVCDKKDDIEAISCLYQFYNAFIGSHLFYNGFMLCRFRNEDIDRIQRLQNMALKMVYNQCAELLILI